MNRLSGALGMCIRARKCVTGYESCIISLREKKSYLVLLADNASDTTKKRITDKCKYYNTNIIELDLTGTLEELNLNENIRIISINDINFRKLIYKKLEGDI